MQSVLQADYSQVALPVSALSAWPLGWLQNLNFCLVGSLLLAYAVSVHRALPRGRASWIALALLVMSGTGVILVGVFPWYRAGGDLVEPTWHGVGAIMTFFGAGAGLVGMSRRMVKDPSWEHLSRIVLGCGVAMLILFFVLAGFAIEEGMPLHPWAGLLQRLVLLIWFPCIIVTANKVFNMTQRSLTR